MIKRHNQIRQNRSKFIKYLLISLGSLSWAIGIIGILVPILPTTPFLLLSSFCYAKSSNRFYFLLQNNKIFGHYIVQWQKDKSIPIKAKVFAIFLIILSIGTSILFFINLLIIKISLGLLGLIIIIFLLQLKTKNTKIIINK